MKRELKEKIVDELKSALSNSKGIWLTDFRGLDVETIGKLRRRLRENSLRYQVVKNSILQFALQKAKIEPLTMYLDGPTGICFGDDPVLVARILTEFQREVGAPNLKVGWFDGKILSPGEIKDIALIPGRDVLLSEFLNILVAPLSNLIFTLQSILRKLVLILDEVVKKKGV
ncbi:MAG: 50S ribosomal protein L10 [bacterium]|nr:50S ribosomal protein L10 [bacterium]